MATRTTANTREAANGSPDLGAIRDEMKQLRAQIETATRGAARAGRTRFDRAKVSASDTMDDLVGEAEARLEEFGNELAHYEQRAIATVRERPMQSIGIALAVGFLIAFFFRR